MMSQSNKVSKPITFTHAKKIAGYNWRLYAVTAFAVLIAAAILVSTGSPFWLRCFASLGIVVALWYTVASVWAFHLMFDRSELLDGQWLHAELPQPPKDWVQINAGLGETTIQLQNVFPNATGKLIDIYDSESMTEPAITLAREQLAASGMAVSAKCDALPVDDNQTALALVMLAAHEIRNRGARERFFRELARIVSSSGKVIVVEHLRDLAATLAFGPGMFHFFPRREWIELGTLVNLKLERERAITPFVRVFVFSRN